MQGDRDKIHNHIFPKLNNLRKESQDPYWDRQLPKILASWEEMTGHLYHWNAYKLMISGHKWNALKMSIQWVIQEAKNMLLAQYELLSTTLLILFTLSLCLFSHITPDFLLQSSLFILWFEVCLPEVTTY